MGRYGQMWGGVVRCGEMSHLESGHHRLQIELIRVVSSLVGRWRRRRYAGRPSACPRRRSCGRGASGCGGGGGALPRLRHLNDRRHAWRRCAGWARRSGSSGARLGRSVSVCCRGGGVGGGGDEAGREVTTSVECLQLHLQGAIRRGVLLRARVVLVEGGAEGLVLIE